MIKIGIIMDEISSINIEKDSSFAMLMEAQNRGYQIFYMEINSLYLFNNEARAHTNLLSVSQNYNKWFNFNDEKDISLGDLDVILIRKDPPFNKNFIHATYILDFAEKENVLIINKPKTLRDYNEKIFSIWFSKYIPNTLVSQSDSHIRSFLQQHNDIILKPLDGMGGLSIFRVKKDDPNLTVIIETITNYGKNLCIAQKYLPDIKYGDKRILIVDGKPVPYALARIPKQGETRGNLAAGGIGEARPLTDNDWKIAQNIAPIMKKKGLIFVGIDIIGNYLTEINITNPTCIREIESAFPISITGMLMDAIENYLSKKNK